ncbi:methionyl-tRNA formyltransferase [candidate division KSB1 bacterium]
MSNQTISNMVFFGTPQISVFVLEELEKKGMLPSLIITAPDKPRGRKMLMTPPEAKVWAEERGIEVMQPEKIDDVFMDELEAQAPRDGFDVFTVAAYGKLLPKRLLEMPKHGVVNVHPSLLPRLRGANPIRGAILADEKVVGVSIMLVDEKMDHGPIIAQEKVDVPEWPPRGSELDELLARYGGELLSSVLPQWLAGEITPQEQNHGEATLTKKVKKEDGLIDLNDDPYQNLLKIRAYEGWPGTYFFKDDVRVKITDAELGNNELKITRIIPEGKKEMDYETFLMQK